MKFENYFILFQNEKNIFCEPVKVVLTDMGKISVFILVFNDENFNKITGIRIFNSGLLNKYINEAKTEDLRNDPFIRSIQFSLVEGLKVKLTKLGYSNILLVNSGKNKTKKFISDHISIYPSGTASSLSLSNLGFFWNKKGFPGYAYLFLSESAHYRRNRGLDQSVIDQMKNEIRRETRIWIDTLYSKNGLLEVDENKNLLLSNLNAVLVIKGRSFIENNLFNILNISERVRFTIKQQADDLLYFKNNIPFIDSRRILNVFK